MSRWRTITARSSTRSMPSGPYVEDGDASPSSAKECGEPARRVPEVIDVWFDSGAMPFAQHHHPFEHKQGLLALPGRLHLRGARSDAGLVLLAAGDLDAAGAPGAVPERGVPRLDPRWGRAEDVEVEGQHGRAVAGARWLRRGCVQVVLLHLQAAMGRVQVLDRGDRRGRETVLEAAVEHVLLLCVVRARGRRGAEQPGSRRQLRRRRPTSTRARTAIRTDGPDTTSTAGRCRGRPRPPRWWPSGWTHTTRRARAGRSPAGGRASNWYVRRSRRRFRNGQRSAFQTLRGCLLTVAKHARAAVPVHRR